MIYVGYGHRARGNAQVNTPENVTVSPARICHFCHIIWRDSQKYVCDSFPGQSEEKLEKKPIAPHYLAEPFCSVLKPSSASKSFFCHIIWRQREGRTVCSIMLCLQRLQRNLRHIIWRKSAMI